MRSSLLFVCLAAFLAVVSAQDGAAAPAAGGVAIAGLEQVPVQVAQQLQRSKKTHQVKLPTAYMAPQYAAPVVNTRVIKQPILQRTNVKQPIIQPRLIETATIRRRVKKQPVIRRIVTQPVIQPRVIQSAEIQPRIYEQPVYQPRVYQQDEVRQELRERQEVRQAKRHAPRVEHAKRFGEFQQFWGEAGAGPMHPERPEVAAGVMEGFRTAPLEQLQAGAAQGGQQAAEAPKQEAAAPKAGEQQAQGQQAQGNDDEAELVYVDNAN